MSHIIQAVFDFNRRADRNRSDVRQVKLLDRNLTEAWVLVELGTLRIELVRSTDLQALTAGDFHFYEFGAFSRTATGVKTSLTERWRSGIARGRTETNYNCRLIDGQWQVEEGELSFDVYN